MMENKDLQYQEFIRMLVRSNDSRIFLNSDEDHALTVLVEIIKASNEHLRVFAGNLCKHIGNQKEYIVAISDFIERGGEVRILLNRFNSEEAKESDLFKRLSYYKNMGKPVCVKGTTAHPYFSGDEARKEVHFTIGDNKSYRIETDIEKRTAQCCMNDANGAASLIQFYDGLFEREEAKEIDITSLF